MRTTDDHVKQAQLNREMLEQLPARRFDWQITVCFYTALHWMNAVTRRMGKPEAQDHTQTFQNILEARLPPEVRKAYQDLFAFSMDARYECFAVDSLEEICTVSLLRLERIETYARGILKV